MKITAYIHPKRAAITPTGVGKHIIHMVSRLAKLPGIDLRVLAANEELKEGKLDSRTTLENLPTLGHPLSRSVMEKLWLVTGHPLADRWTGECDWVYCPAEAFVPVRRSRLVVTIHATYWFENLSPEFSKHKFWFKRLFEKILHQADQVVTVSEFMKGRLVELFGARPERIAIVGNGVEPVYYDAKPSPPPVLSGQPYVIVVGGLTWIKGAESILGVAQALQNRGSGLKIVVMGHTDPRYIQQAKSLPNIVDIGYQPAEIASGIMAGSVSLLFLSRYESFGIPATEAMAAGAPAVVSRGGALPEAVGDAGIVVDAAKTDEIADLLVTLSKDESLRAKHIELGKIRARNFTWDACVQKLIDAMKHSG